jgi:hypothetical protein
MSTFVNDYLQSWEKWLLWFNSPATAFIFPPCLGGIGSFCVWYLVIYLSLVKGLIMSVQLMRISYCCFQCGNLCWSRSASYSADQSGTNITNRQALNLNQGTKLSLNQARIAYLHFQVGENPFQTLLSDCCCQNYLKKSNHCRLCESSCSHFQVRSSSARHRLVMFPWYH